MPPRCPLDYPPGSVLYADLRQKWNHEDDLIHQRVTWLLSSQAFLLTGFGALAKLRLDVEAGSGDLWAMIRDQLWLLFSLGETLIVLCAVVVTFYLRHGITAAIEAMAQIKRQLVDHQLHGRVWSAVRVDVHDGTTAAGAAPSRALANTFLRVWLLFMVYEVWRSASVLVQLVPFR